VATRQRNRTGVMESRNGGDKRAETEVWGKERGAVANRENNLETRGRNESVRGVCMAELRGTAGGWNVLKNTENKAKRRREIESRTEGSAFKKGGDSGQRLIGIRKAQRGGNTVGDTIIGEGA